MDTTPDINSVSDIISLWPSAEQFAKDIGLKYPSYGRVIKMRRRLPERYWPAALESAEKRGYKLTKKDLERANAASKEPEVAA
jgi:hypothetical protein